MAVMKTMVSMELDDEDSYDSPTPIPTDKPDYPWGLRISLTEKELAKLDLDPDDAVVGGLFHMHAMARITCVSKNDSGDGAGYRVEAQIEDLEIESEDEENEMNDEAEDRKLY